MTDYKAEYDKLVERLWHIIDCLGRDRPLMMTTRDLEQLLPPRPPKYEEVPWWQAIEGLKSGKYRRAQPACWGGGVSQGVFWQSLEGQLYYSDTPYYINEISIGTWRAELA